MLYIIDKENDAIHNYKPSRVNCIKTNGGVFMKIRWKTLIISLVISLGVGAISGFLSKDSMQSYSELIKPALSPPGWVFPVVWTILFALMGISAYLVFISNSPNSKQALYYYFIQLGINFLWPLLFFNLEAYLFSFFWLVLLWIFILLMILEMKKANEKAAYLQIPYFLWVTFAGYLNFMIYLLNK